MAATAWFNAPGDVEAYRRLADAVDEWNAYCAPTIEDIPGEAELLDEVAYLDPLVPLAEAAQDVEARQRHAAQRRLKRPLHDA
jgi:hypothetical protein